MSKFGRISVERLVGDERFHRNGVALDASVLGLWRWACSDLLSNAFRGTVAEYLVAADLGVETGVRSEWEAYDLLARDGTKVEVKSAAYIQTWNQARPSAIRFNIPSTQAWDADSGWHNDGPRRHADVYVFCLLDHMDQATIDPLDLAQWRFFALSRARLDQEVGQQKGIALSRLRTLGPVEASFGGIEAAICETLRQYPIVD